MRCTLHSVQKTDLAGKKWHIYSSNSGALYCLVTVAKSNNKVSGFCKGIADFDQGTQVAITGGKLNVNKSCSITGSIKMAADGVSQIFGNEDTVIKIVKSKILDRRKYFMACFQSTSPVYPDPRLALS